jgi:anti-anti-sigma factor
VLSFQMRGGPPDPRNGIHTLLLSGEADLAVVDELTARGLTALADPGVTTLVIDLHDVTFIDCAVLGALVRLRNAAGVADKRFYLAHPSARVQRVLELAGLAFDALG